jgi:flagellar biosynthetic protein FliR
MPASSSLAPITAMVVPWTALSPFLLVLTRLGTVFAFVPVPGWKSSPSLAKITIVVCLSAALVPVLPPIPALPDSGGAFVVAMCGELAFGTAVGLAVSLLSETFTFAMQAFALQAGYAYASSIDPNTEADSGVLLIFGQLAADLLFFAFGVHRFVLRSFIRSLETLPPGAVLLPSETGDLLIRLGSSMFDLGLRLALPVAGLLLLTDLTLAVLGRLQMQLQLLSLAFPLKMLGALAVLAMLAPVFSSIYEKAFRFCAGTVGTMVAR